MRPHTATAAALASRGLAAVAQFTDVTCDQNKWTFNSAGQSPCTVWSELSAICSVSPFLVPRLTSPGDKYSPPSGNSNDKCHCNVVAFNLASACTICQSGFSTDSLLSESQWQAGCTTYNDSGISQDHPAVNVPAWAFMKENGHVFQSLDAEQLALSGTINPSATTTSTTPGSTSLITTAPAGISSSPQTPAQEAQVTSAKHKSPVGPIVGGVLGGLALLALLVFLVFRYRNYRRSQPALVPTRARDVDVRQKEFGMPSDLKIQHFVPPPPGSSAHTSVEDNLNNGGRALHPYAAGYAVQRNVPERERSYTSSSNYATVPSAVDTQHQHSIMPFGPGNITPPASGKASPSADSALLTPFSATYTYTSPRSGAAHPYASPLINDSYERALPETPLPYAYMHEPVSATAPAAPPTPMPSRPLPPLRVPQPVRHSSTSTTEFSPSSWDSAAPLVQQQKQQQGSIDSRIMSNSGSQHSHTHTHSHPRAHGKAPRQPVPAPNDWVIE
ncbi:hypothetical protein EXIGLDRAFT_828936 [Exidia glandulosa HHB12029]|uniref:Uncharacterized protein n=1 Tax=Exidia glandulosa HHB12029 TaxID=1314781 RepID=A0A166BNS3_EXIGL|nr:hypothetical protein EXIGLDRAFT_828936 [Exidia glandulosa HHB12029]